MRTRSPRQLAYFLAVALFLLLPAGLSAPSAALANSAQNQRLEKILGYIASSWSALMRSMQSCETFSDPKTGSKSVVYLPAGFTAPASLKEATTKCHLTVKPLPNVIKKLGEVDMQAIHPHGLLYLPQPYVVPGGMFNEMYGWDSYFIIRGLIQDGRLDLAREILENFFFEVENYGGVLNANRTYYLTRSQPPFLTSMIREIYNAEPQHSGGDAAWLAEAYRCAVKDYTYWTTAPHLAGDTGLSRYYGLGNGPVPELGDQAFDYYRQVVRYFLLHPADSQPYLVAVGADARVVGPEFSLVMSENGSPEGSSVQKLALTSTFYKGDRSMRESGFDVSFRFGPFGAGTPNFAAVDLNSLLYKAEKDLAWMSSELGRKAESEEWNKRALQRQAAVNRYLWNARQGMYYDYDFKRGVGSLYTYATTFYPLWAGLASPAQAQAVVANLPAFEQPGGLMMSVDNTGAQWDAPYGWAPIQLLASEGLRRYGYDADANRISREFLSMVLDNFWRDGTIREKYNVMTRSSETQIQVGYKANVVGFGWTNGVFLALLRALPKEAQAQLSRPKTQAAGQM